MEDLHDLIDASELLVTVPSTAALEAIILGKPVVILQIRKGEDNPIFSKYPVVTVRSKEDIAKGIEATLGDSELKQTLDKERAVFLSSDGEYPVDGKSTERMINLINELCSH